MSQSTTKKAPVFRYKFSDMITVQLNNFAQIHKHESRQDFKDSWDSWIENNKEVIQLETNRLEQMGFQGNIEDKMYKSTRYYFCKKTNEKKQPQKRRKYVSISKELINAMDIHIEICLRHMNVDMNNDVVDNLQKENNNNPNEYIVYNYKPSTGFINFCETNYYLVQNEKDRIYKESKMNNEDIELKLKKTYKNRYFIQTN